MASGLLLAGLWLVLLVLAMGERALTFASRSRLEELIERQAVRDRYLRFLDRAEPAALSCMLGRVACAAALIAVLLRHAAAQGHPLVPFAVAGAAAVAGAELLGRLVARQWSAAVLMALLPPLQLPAIVLEPVFALWQRAFEGPDSGPPEEVVEAAKEEIRVAIEDAASEGALHSDEKEMIEGVLEFRDAEVSEIMTPRTEIEWIEADTPLAKALATIRKFLHSRVPVYHGTRDRVVGMVHVKDLLRAADEAGAGQKSLREFMREPFFVPQTKRLVSLLREFKQKHAQIAIVLDEYGGVIGLVTIEDVLEEIVGEIEDEFDHEDHESRVRIVEPDTVDVDGRVHIDELNDVLGTELPEDEDFDTVAGFVMARFASVPKKGQEASFDGVLVRVLDSDSQRVRRVLLKREGRADEKGQ